MRETARLSGNVGNTNVGEGEGEGEDGVVDKDRDRAVEKEDTNGGSTTASNSNGNGNGDGKASKDKGTEKAVGDLDYATMSQQLQVKRRDSLDKIPVVIPEVASLVDSVNSAADSVDNSNSGLSGGSDTDESRPANGKAITDEVLPVAVKAVLGGCYEKYAVTLLETA